MLLTYVTNIYESADGNPSYVLLLTNVMIHLLPKNNAL